MEGEEREKEDAHRKDLEGKRGEGKKVGTMRWEISTQESKVGKLPLFLGPPLCSLLR